jgi:putative hemolysin
MDPGDPLSGKEPLLFGGGSFVTFYGPYLALLLGLLALAALISAAEAAFFSLPADDRAQCRSSDNLVDQRIANLLNRPRRLLATLVIFNNLLNISIVVIATYLTWLVSQSSPTSSGLLAGVTLTVTVLIVLFGEMVPKVYANQHSLAVARWTSGLAQAASVVFRPLAVLLVGVSSQIDRRIERRGYTLSADELSQAVELTGSDVSTEEKEMLKGIVNFSNRTARQVMRARVDITAFPDDLMFSELLARLNEAGYSRVPVYRESVDQVEGILYLKDLLPHLHADDSFGWQTLIRPAYIIPEIKKIDDLLHEFQKRRVHIAIVVDEYGSTRGLITLEDIIEEIFGDINDEFDEEHPAGFRRIDPQTVAFEGRTPLPDVCRVLGVDAAMFDAVSGDSESLGGLLLELFGRLPATGDVVNSEEFVFRVIDADDKRILEVEITNQSGSSPIVEPGD